jgi:hypothetical protein
MGREARWSTVARSKSEEDKSAQQGVEAGTSRQRGVSMAEPQREGM